MNSHTTMNTARTLSASDLDRLMRHYEHKGRQLRAQAVRDAIRAVAASIAALPASLFAGGRQSASTA